jgi:chromosomal replication initiation ATPase DnaA
LKCRIKTVESIRGEKWETIRDRYGDWGRELALYLRRKAATLPLRESGVNAGGMDYEAVSMAIRRFERRLNKDTTLCQTAATARQLLNVKT